MGDSNRREEYVEYCVPDYYMKIPCPVMRGLVGSGFIKWENANGGASPQNIKDVLKGNLGVSGELLDGFGFLDVIADADSGLIDLIGVEGIINHAASTGIIGANTGGASWDHHYSNLDRFEKLLSCSSDGLSVTVDEWGRCCDMFAGERYKESLVLDEDDQKDVSWANNTFSWTTLITEFSNLFQIFKNGEKLSVATVTSLWRNGKMPSGWDKPLRYSDKPDSLAIA